MKSSCFSFLFLIFSNVLPVVIGKIGAKNESFNYERMHMFGLGRKIIRDYRRLDPMGKYGYEYPGPMPTTKRTKPAIKYPFESYQQGMRKLGDVKVYSQTYGFKPHVDRGHHYLANAVLDCIINYMTVETKQGIPIKLRGGVGYHYFAVITKAKAGHPLIGKVEVWCVRDSSYDGRRLQEAKTLTDGDLASSW